MNRLPDRAKMRREYLRQLRDAYTRRFLGWIVMLLFGLITFGFIGAGLGAILTGQLIGLLCLLGAAVFGRMAWGGVTRALRAKAEAASLRYVPPVHEQIDTLPAEEVLLRGSQALPVSPEELLRPATVSQDTPAEELLRPTHTV